ncbi:hypothetical protein AB1Y20_015785 [Prymnesium parvum]|uniref:Uncharacterized protein n=1 Tax=Prymnesium parvum TaxID=97485 RepID=A0AB34K1Y8_PRYPA
MAVHAAQPRSANGTSTSPAEGMSSWVRPDVFRQLSAAQDAFAAQLNLIPTFWFLLPLAIFFSITSWFLQQYVVEGATAHLAVFAVGAYIVFSSYFVCDYTMSRRSTSYASIPDDKKFYVLSNLIKSAVLFSYCPLAVHVLYEALAFDRWSTARIRNLGVLYAIPDFVSLFLVSRMSTTTKLHHSCVVIFMVYNLYTDYSTESVARALVVYAVFSTFAYLVNLLLASRFLQIGATVSLCMSIVALGLYGGCLAINWCWQVRFLWGLYRNNPSIGIYIYCTFMSMVVYDDVVLVRWLWNNVQRKARLANSRADKTTKNK